MLTTNKEFKFVANKSFRVTCQKNFSQKINISFHNLYKKELSANGLLGKTFLESARSTKNLYFNGPRVEYLYRI